MRSLLILVLLAAPCWAATTPVEFLAPSGLTLSVELYALGSDTIANTGGDSATEATNRHGLYSCDVTEALAGVYSCHIVDASNNLIAAGWVALADDTTRYRVVGSYLEAARLDAAITDRTLAAAAYFDASTDLVSLAATTIDSMWRELLADHSGVSGSVAEALNSAAVGSTVSPILIGHARTWVARTDSATAPNVITLAAGDDVALAMDFARVLNDGTSISSITSVVEATSTGATVDNPALSLDKKQAYADVTGLTAGTMVKLTYTVGTTDSQTLTYHGMIQVD